ncbi:hypothetical protein OROMI_016596 [Orobanche minor]
MFLHVIYDCSCSLYCMNYHKMVGIWVSFCDFILSLWGPIFVTKKLFQNRANLYNNALTCDIRLLMQSLSNVLSRNRQNFVVFIRFYSYFLGPIFDRKINSESVKFLQQCFHMCI